ncbi:hypothetical protein CYY_004126 [Polysphondylium violaceum]|uniref:NB-ARC domain-containing protein n=1 Tax=Polysphondylium violaceum TaxID=133409 RepID=A0A8J4UZK2_9MYCE|nr:hypothetical protein CYY_004126 [Polysphondylium violaceum]
MNQHCVCILHSGHTEVLSTISIFEKNSAIKFSDVKQSSDFAYREGVLEINNNNESDNTVRRSIRVILSFPSNQTSGEIVLNTSHVLDTFKPSLAIIVGTCSGYKDNETPISRGDIIVGQSAFNYQTGINTNDGLRFTLNDCIQSNKSLLNALKLTDHSKSDWIKYPSIEVSTTYKREWLLRAFFEYQDHKDNLEKSVWLRNQYFDIKKTPARNTVVQKMFGNQYNKEKDELVKDGLMEQDENGIPNISDKGFKKMDILLNRYGDYPYNLFKEIKPNIHFGQFGCGSALEQQYEVVDKKRISLAFKQCREKSTGIIAIDRDTHAFYLTTQNYKEISFISVKSVLDYADGDTNQNNNYIDYCNQLSSSFALHLIRSHSFESNDFQLIRNFIPPPPIKSINRLGSDNKGYIQLISDSFKSKSKSNSVTISSRISGMGGVGKSTLAKQFALHCIDNQLYKYIFWIHSETQETLFESYKQILQHLNVEIKNQDNIVTAFASSIQQLQLKGNVLLIYDNVEDMSLIREKPQGNHINILITTRSQMCDDPSSTLIPLDLLNLNECKSLFKLWRPNITDTHIAELSILLQRLPLAISHCLAYMYQEGIEEWEYIKEFEMFNEIQVIGDDSFENPYEILIGKTISMAIGKMKNKQDIESRATTVLHIMAFLNPDQIHSKVLEIILKGKDNHINAVIKILKNFSLISTDQEANSNQNYNISIHRVVQRSIIVLLLQKLKNNNSINLIYDNLSHINNQISTYFYSNNTNINIRNSNSNSILLDNYNNLNNISIHLTNIQTIIQKMDNLPHQQNLELTNKLLLTQIIMECNHLSYLILNSTVNRQVLEALFQEESNIDKNNISELVDITFQFINQNQQLTQGIDSKIALNIFSKFMSGESIDKDKCNIILKFIFLSLGKIGHFLDKDIQFFKKTSEISILRISLINELLFRLPGQVLNFSQLQNMFTINPIASDNDYSILIDKLVHLNDKVKGLDRSDTEIIFNSFNSFKSIDPTIIHFTTNLVNESTNDNHISKIILILIKFKLTFKNDKAKIVFNYIEELFDIGSFKDFANKFLEVLSKINFDKFNCGQIEKLFNYTNELINEKFNGHHISFIISTISEQTTKYRIHSDQIKNIINYTKQLINEKMNSYDISSIISTLSEQITKYQLNNDQIETIMNYTKQLINENMNCDHISTIISTLFEKITKFKNYQIQSIINHIKQLINMNHDQLYKILSTLPDQITKLNGQILLNYCTKQLLNGYDIYLIKSIISEHVTKCQLNNDQIQTIINYTKQLINEKMDRYVISSIISTLSKNFKFNNDQIETIINYTKQLINEKMDRYDISSIISTLSDQITKYQLNSDQIQTIIYFTTQLINEKMNGDHISSIISILLKQIIKYQFNNDHIQTIINYTKQLINVYMSGNQISRFISTISKQITIYQFNNDEIQTVINYTKQFINEFMDVYEEKFECDVSKLYKKISKNQLNYETSKTAWPLPNEIVKYQITKDQLINYTICTLSDYQIRYICYPAKQSIDEIMDGYNISSIISTFSEQITKYQLNNDQIKNICKLTIQLMIEGMNGDQISIILTLSAQLYKYKLNNDQIQNIINYTKQLIDEKMNGDDISSIISSLSEQITEYQLNNDQILTIINYTKQLMNEKMNGDDISLIISTLSDQIIKYQLHNDQIQNISNLTKQLINEKMESYHISSIISTLSKQITKYQLNNDQIQNITNYIKQLINEKMNGYEISSIISTLSEQITEHQFNNDQILTIINYTKQLMNEKMNGYDISKIMSNLSEQISQDPSNFKECFKNNIILKACSHLGFRYSFSYILHIYRNNPLAFEQSYICILSLNQIIESNQFLNFLEIVIACNSEERNYIMAKLTSEYRDKINAQTNLAQDKILSMKEKDNCCLKNRHNSLDENDTDARVLFTKLNDVKEHIQDYDFKILSRQFSFHPNLFKESIIKSFIKIKNSLGLVLKQHGFQYLIFQSLYPYDDDQLELVCDIIEKTREHKQEYFCCDLHIANNIQRLYYYNYKFTIGNNNFLQVFYSQLKDIDNNSNLECMKTVLLNTLNPKIRFNANI